ncbi:MAG: hypothetical protein RDV48_27370 [Candidatus Eremiobacteraeota bacterium]|nr:hypothetical protein [Candidatus Eremiobacteraeota bacterium]
MEIKSGASIPATVRGKAEMPSGAGQAETPAKTGHNGAQLPAKDTLSLGEESLDFSLFKPSMVYLRSRFDPIYRKINRDSGSYVKEAIEQVTPLNLGAELVSTGTLIASCAAASLAPVPVLIDGGKGIYNLVRGMRRGNRKQETEGLLGIAKGLAVAGIVIGGMLPGGVTAAIVAKTALAAAGSLYGYVPAFRSFVNSSWDKVNKAVPEKLKVRESASHPGKTRRKKRGRLRRALRKGTYKAFDAMENNPAVRKADELINRAANSLAKKLRKKTP